MSMLMSMLMLMLMLIFGVRTTTLVVSVYLNTGYREDPINSPYYKYLIREILLRDVRTATDMVLHTLLASTIKPGSYIDVMGNHHSMTQEYTQTSQPLGSFEAKRKSNSCKDACHKRQKEIYIKGKAQLDCEGICRRHISSLYAAPVKPYRLLLYWSDKNMYQLREWMINRAVEVTRSSMRYKSTEMTARGETQDISLDMNVKMRNDNSDEL